MNKIVGARISDLLYKKMKEDGRSNTIIIREALSKFYLTSNEKNDVNRVFIQVKNEIIGDRHKKIAKKVDKL